LVLCVLATATPAASIAGSQPLYALPILINQTLDSDWFRGLAIIAFALSGVVFAATGQYLGALISPPFRPSGAGIVRDLLFQRQPIGVVQNPEQLRRAGRHGRDPGNVARSRRCLHWLFT
jgi:hypothetical protein